MFDKSDEKARQRAKQKRDRARDKKQASQAAALFYDMRIRCNTQFDDAVEQIDKLGISFDEFTSPDWDCRRCPMFVQCSIAQNFTEHPQGWKFNWLEGT